MRSIRVIAVLLMVTVVAMAASAQVTVICPTNCPVTVVTWTPTAALVTSTPKPFASATNAPILSATPSQTPTQAEPTPTPENATVVPNSGARGYTTSPAELGYIAAQAQAGVEPYKSEVTNVLTYANRSWNYTVAPVTSCGGADTPAWQDDAGGTPILYGKALAYWLTGNAQYAADVKSILESIGTKVTSITTSDQQCRLNFGWSVPEMVAAADLIEDYWRGLTCTGTTTTVYGDTVTGSGSCKRLFQNWLVKNPYYIISYAAEDRVNNWAAAATTALAYIADYVQDRGDLQLTHRMPGAANVFYTPAQAYAHANQLALDRMNGYRVEGSGGCDAFSASLQNSQYAYVKSQITENGILPDELRRDEDFCNLPHYAAGKYENYPQVALGNNIQQCELMLRRGDSRCYDNVATNDIPAYTFVSGGKSFTTHLYAGRGSIERAINAIIVDAGTPWQHDEALKLAYRYYVTHYRLSAANVARWKSQFSAGAGCSQDVCLALAGVP